MSNELTVLYRGLLQETLNLLESFGVKDGVGKDGELKVKIRDALGTAAINVVINSARPSKCPLCGEPALDCDCDPAEQMAAMG